jgi:hypothetical protein
MQVQSRAIPVSVPWTKSEWHPAGPQDFLNDPKFQTFCLNWMQEEIRDVVKHATMQIEVCNAANMRAGEALNPETCRRIHDAGIYLAHREAPLQAFALLIAAEQMIACCANARPEDTSLRDYRNMMLVLACAAGGKAVSQHFGYTVDRQRAATAEAEFLLFGRRKTTND